MLPSLLGKKQANQIRNSIIHHSMWRTFSICHENWKLIKGRGSGGFTLPAKIIPKKGEPKGQLYDLEKDPEEKIKLWNDKPRVVESLENMLVQIKKKKQI